ncbi:hypothetical protein ACFYYP_40295 [Microbispora rosea]|uniref:hypothetical protein n=1 Tax=Microbispora rosea TaxID=58117 RepID=UPI0036C7B49F
MRYAWTVSSPPPSSTDRLRPAGWRKSPPAGTFREYQDLVEVPVTVAPAGYDLVTWAQDVYADVAVDGDDAGETDLTPVRLGHSVAFDWAIRAAL